MKNNHQSHTQPNSPKTPILLNTQSHMIDDFWNDCLSPKRETSQKKPKKKKNPITLRILHNFYNLHPEVYEEEIAKQKEIQKRKCAEQRCHNMYFYALQQQNYLKSVYNENQEQKIKSEIEKCTWKPKVNKLTKKQEEKIKSKGNTIYQRDQAKLFHNKYKLYKKTTPNNNYDNTSLDDEQMGKDILFHPKVNSNPNFNKMFNKSLLSNRENAEFVMRYAKAREEHLSKREKIIYSKENSVNVSLTSYRKNIKSSNNSSDKRRYKQSLHKSLYLINFDEDSD